MDRKVLNSGVYEDICDWVILNDNHYDKIIDSGDLRKKNGILYCRTTNVIRLFEYLNEVPSNNRLILITNQSDLPINVGYFRRKPNNIKKWFAVNIDHVHPDLTGIPLGTKTPMGRSWCDPFFDIPWFQDNIERFQKKKKKPGLFCNWRVANEFVPNDPSRDFVIQKLPRDLKHPIVFAEDMPFKEYAELASDYQFIVSPRGNGIDCHRTWEAVYMGSIPIVKQDYLYSFWPELPILMVNEFTDLNDKILEEAIKKEYNTERAYADYWIKEIPRWRTQETIS